MKLTIKSTDQHPIRLGSFADLFTVGSYDGKPTNYSAQLLIPKGSPALAELEAAIRTFAKEQFGDAAKMAIEKQNASNTKLLRDGDGIDGMTANGQAKQGWAGHMRVKASTKFAPKIIDRSMKDLTAEDGKPYPGCAVSAQIEIYKFSDKKELGFRLHAVQFFADGEPFGGGGGGVDLDAFGPAVEAPKAGESEW